MCGICGFISHTGVEYHAIEGIARSMADTLSSRGPDDQGVWLAPDRPVALAHRRLAILDLSAAGHQPMRSFDHRYSIVFNGEIYNHLDLRAELEKNGQAPAWRGHSDTETLLAALAAWGVKQTLCAASGMFAFAVWDAHVKTLTLARDRMGEKPLYYGWSQNSFVFASEPKALRAYPGWRPEIDRNALTAFMRYGYVPSPKTIWHRVWKLPPGSFLEIRSDQSGEYTLQPQQYWSTEEVASRGLADQLQNEGDAIEALESVLSTAIERQCLADVPLGAFLSGGVDSSTIVALMQKHSRVPVRTFAIGFDDEQYNEAQHAADVARHLRTDHTELYVTAHQARDVIPQLPTIYDEPFADSSQIPTFLVAKMARQHVAVALSGDGGDELFGGYNRYTWAQRMWQHSAGVPPVIRHAAGGAMRALSPNAWNRIYSLASPLLPTSLRVRRPGDQVHKLASVLGATDARDLYKRLTSLQQSPQRSVLQGREEPTWASEQLEGCNLAFVDYMMLADQLGYLCDDILVKVDRAAMAVSLETRVPLLDPKVVELAWRIPSTMKIRNGVSKWILRQVLYKHVPSALIERPKTGFGIPLDRWLRTNLREWAEVLLSKRRIEDEGFLDAEVVDRHWRTHLAGGKNNAYWLWNVLMFQAWLDQYARSN